jgi:hypothetical protein
LLPVTGTGGPAAWFARPPVNTGTNNAAASAAETVAARRNGRQRARTMSDLAMDQYWLTDSAADPGAG